MNTVAQSATDHDSSWNPPSARPRRILFVDDEALLLRLGEVFLRRLGYDVVTSICPCTALSLFEKEEFDAVITDLSMPGMSGIELAEAIRKLNPAFPVILTTAFYKKVEGKTPAELGFRSLLLKPYDLDKLSDALKSVFT